MAVTTYNTAGSGNWLCPVGVTSIQVECWGGGAGGSRGAVSGNPGGGGGGGGEYAKETTVAVTPGKLYAWTVGQGGAAGAGQGNNNGGLSSFTGDTLAIIANGGITGGGSRQGGSGSTNTTHFSGGNGGTGAAVSAGGGGGGGSSAGTAAGGGNGGNGSGTSPGAGGSAPAGGGTGGQGGQQFPGPPVAPSAGVQPGGGGGGGAGGGMNGAAGAAGRVQLTYTLATQPIVPYFNAGFSPLNSNFDAWIQAPLSFLTSRVVFRAEKTTALTLTNNTATVIPFDSILEDPFSGWQAGSSQWQCPAGYSGIYSVTLTVSAQPNATGPVISARVGINTSATVLTVDKAWVPPTTVPGIASGSQLVSLFGGQDTVQGIAFLAGATGAVQTTAGQRCELTIQWYSL